jgi:hypothetical protein
MTATWLTPSNCEMMPSSSSDEIHSPPSRILPGKCGLVEICKSILGTRFGGFLFAPQGHFLAQPSAELTARCKGLLLAVSGPSRP